MKTIPIPYHTGTVPLHSKKNSWPQSLRHGRTALSPGGRADIIEHALRNPIGSRPLHELAAGKRDIVLVTSDHTRAVPSRLTLPVLLREIRVAARRPYHHSDCDWTASPNNGPEQRRMFGDDIVDRENIVVNDAFVRVIFDMGRLPSGASFCVHRLAVQCDLLVAEGLLSRIFLPVFLAAAKAFCPASARRKRSMKITPFTPLPALCAAGVLNQNPVHEDMLEAARRVNLQFIFNVALSGDKQVIAAFAGHFERRTPQAWSLCARLPSVHGLRGYRRHIQRRLPAGPEPVSVGQSGVNGRRAAVKAELSSCAAAVPTAWAGQF